MPNSRKLKKLIELATTFVSNPMKVFFGISQLGKNIQGFNYSLQYTEKVDTDSLNNAESNSPKRPSRLEEFFDARKVGPGIWKWRHYFSIYDRHFNKFINSNVKILEIGIFSGGSLDMWQDYFGEKCHIYGVDIAEECKAFGNDKTTVYIGDQEDRGFWKKVKAEIPKIDILIDDGGHGSGQQIATFEEMLPHLLPGGIYVCEDVHNINNGFNSYCQGLTKGLNDMKYVDPSVGHKKGVLPNDLQAWIKGIYSYPYMIVIEKAEEPLTKLIAPKHGTQWLPIRTT